MEDDRRAILARRARFIAAALAGAGLSAGAGSCAAEQRPATQAPATQAEIIVPAPDAAPEEEAADAELPGRSAVPEVAPPKPPDPYPRICLSEY